MKITKREAKLNWEWKQPRLEARRLQFAEDESVKHFFRQRSGGEAPMSILKGKMGLSRIRRRGFAKTILAVFLAATARNVLRTRQWLLRKAEEAMSKNWNSQALPCLIRICRLVYAALERTLLKTQKSELGFLWAA